MGFNVALTLFRSHSDENKVHRVFEQRLIFRPTPVEATSKKLMSRAGAIRDFVLWRDELRQSIFKLGNS